jgi:hypothetical protein
MFPLINAKGAAKCMTIDGPLVPEGKIGNWLASRLSWPQQWPSRSRPLTCFNAGGSNDHAASLPVCDGRDNLAVAAPVTAQSVDGCHRPASVGE